MIRFEIEGLDEMEAHLKDWAPKEADKVMRAAVQGVVSYIRKDVVQHTPVGPTGNLKRSIKTRTRRTGNGRFGGEVYSRAPHWHLVNFGTGERVQRSGRRTGKSPARKFVTVAIAKGAKHFQRVANEAFARKYWRDLAKRIG